MSAFTDPVGPTGLTGEARIAAFNRDYGASDADVVLVSRLREFLTSDQVARVLDLVDDVCLHCFDGPRWCQCANDE